MRLVLIPSLLAGLLLCATPVVAQTNTRSSPEDQQRFVSITHNLEKAPLKPGLQADRQWAIQWLTDAPDVSVTACLDPLAGVSQANYSHGAEIVVQYILSIGAFIIQHPEKEKDPVAQQLAGVEGALNAYRSILKAEPAANSPPLEKLLDMQARGQLPGFVRKAYVRCSAEGGEQVHLP
jgi:hypothetical protein